MTKWWFSIAMLIYQRVTTGFSCFFSDTPHMEASINTILTFIGGMVDIFLDNGHILIRTMTINPPDAVAKFHSKPVFDPGKFSRWGPIVGKFVLNQRIPTRYFSWGPVAWAIFFQGFRPPQPVGDWLPDVSVRGTQQSSNSKGFQYVLPVLPRFFFLESRRFPIWNRGFHCLSICLGFSMNFMDWANEKTGDFSYGIQSARMEVESTKLTLFERF